MVFSVSYTTRRPRPGEQEGVDYHFVEADRFDRMVAAGGFAEWAEVHGNRYGTGMDAVRHALDGHGDAVFDIDYQGGRQIAARFPEQAVMIFILPPSMSELEARLRRRATDSEGAIEHRLRQAKNELNHYGEYRYLVVNDDLDVAYEELRAVYLAARAERARRAARAEALIGESRGGAGGGDPG